MFSSISSLSYPFLFLSYIFFSNIGFHFRRNEGIRNGFIQQRTSEWGGETLLYYPFQANLTYDLLYLLCRDQL